MPSLAIWMKDASGSSMSRRRTAESRGFGRDVSPFHLITWVHLCLAVCWLVVVGLVAFVFVVLDVTQVFCMAFALSQ